MVDFSAGFSSDYDDPYFAGVATAEASLVPGTYAVAINGHPYMLNTDPQAIETYGDNFKEESLPLLRQQADQARLPGESSLSPAQFWRRSQDTWHAGAGQSAYDREESIPQRYATSKGVNPWTRYQLTLLPDTTNIRASANTGLLVAVANTNIYVVDGTTIAGTSNLTAFTTVTGTPATAATSITANGGLAWSAHGTNGIYQINATTASSYVTGTVSVLGYAKGRLLAAHNQALYNPTAAGALPAALFTHPDTGWSWTAFAEGNTVIYAAGAVGDRSRIYRIGVKEDGTGLDVPIPAASLPTGEIVHAMLGYLGFLIVGTSRGVRFATATSSGDLTLGALIPTSGAVHCLDAADRFAWFGWTNYDTVSSGLGRFDLQTINDGLAPAYASDLMGTGQGAVRGTGLSSTLNRRLFTVDGVGVFAEGTTPVASGVVSSGQINYGIADAKVPVAVDLKHAPLPAGTSVSVALSSDRGAATVIGASSATGAVSPPEPISTGARRAEELELSITLSSAGGVGPTVTRWTLLSYPAPVGASTYTLPLLLAPRLMTFNNTDVSQDPFAEYGFLTGLHSSREIFTVQVGNATFEGTLENYKWVPYAHTHDRGFWSGTFIAIIRRIKG